MARSYCRELYRITPLSVAIINDNVNNSGTNSVTFTIIVTADSLITEANEFLALGCIDNAGIANSLASKMAAVKNAIANGQIQAAANILSAFIKEVQGASRQAHLHELHVGGAPIPPGTDPHR
jgi:hypothetical protein